ncbi:zinc ribbon-containing protein [Marinobacter sp. CHS3-4]|uniref:zinc ribbon-containing protein n=1 Tax=Marinobacter sp. CHS3-4 TaxID=3045174 RepID=UPI0024B59B8A|nr:zinc ribbon-containing protein [Marinobacter sp. CHS3-4]MDI9244499.1 zinc ribbon-containing protein [Marinobacter sp. CHS3-4]
MSDQDKKWYDLYERYTEKTKEFFNESKDATVKALDEALDKARESLEKTGELTQEEGRQFKAYLQRDLEQTGNDFDRWSDWVKAHSSPNRVQSGFMDLTGKLAQSGSDFLARLSEWANHTGVYHTGEMAVPGAFKCRSCDEEIHFKSAGKLPPCPRCRKTEFRRVG